MNTTPTHFLVYDQNEQTWRQTSLEELAMLDDPALYITPVYGTSQGQPCTWQEYQQQQKQKEEQQAKAAEEAKKERNKALIAKKAREEQERKQNKEKESQTEWASNLANIAASLVPTCSLVRYTCRFFIVVFCLNCICAGIVAGCAFFEPPVSIIVGLIIGGLCICIVNAIVSVCTHEKEG